MTETGKLAPSYTGKPQPPGPRYPGHADPQWYELDLDDELDDPDTEPVEILPTLRHREVPQ